IRGGHPSWRLAQPVAVEIRAKRDQQIARRASDTSAVYGTAFAGTGVLRVWIDCSAMPGWGRRYGCRAHVSLLAPRAETSLTSPRQFAGAIAHPEALLSPPPGRAATICSLPR